MMNGVYCWYVYQVSE